MALGSIAILKMLKLSIHEHGISFHLFRSSLISFSKESANAGDTGYISMGQEEPLEKKMATHSSIPVWEIPWTEEPGRLQSMRLQKSQTQLSN